MPERRGSNTETSQSGWRQKAGEFTRAAVLGAALLAGENAVEAKSVAADTNDSRAVPEAASSETGGQVQERKDVKRQPKLAIIITPKDQQIERTIGNILQNSAVDSGIKPADIEIYGGPNNMSTDDRTARFSIEILRLNSGSSDPATSITQQESGQVVGGVVRGKTNEGAAKVEQKTKGKTGGLVAAVGGLLGGIAARKAEESINPRGQVRYEDIQYKVGGRTGFLFLDIKDGVKGNTHQVTIERAGNNRRKMIDVGIQLTGHDLNEVLLAALAYILVSEDKEELDKIGLLGRAEFKSAIAEAKAIPDRPSGRVGTPRPQTTLQRQQPESTAVTPGGQQAGSEKKVSSTFEAWQSRGGFTQDVVEGDGSESAKRLMMFLASPQVRSVTHYSEENARKGVWDAAALKALVAWQLWRSKSSQPAGIRPSGRLGPAEMAVLNDLARQHPDWFELKPDLGKVAPEEALPAETEEPRKIRPKPEAPATRPRAVGAEQSGEPLRPGAETESPRQVTPAASDKTDRVQMSPRFAELRGRLELMTPEQARSELFQIGPFLGQREVGFDEKAKEDITGTDISLLLGFLHEHAGMEWKIGWAYRLGPNATKALTQWQEQYQAKYGKALGLTVSGVFDRATQAAMNYEINIRRLTVRPIEDIVYQERWRLERQTGQPSSPRPPAAKPKPHE